MQALIDQLLVLYIFIGIGWVLGLIKKDLGSKSSILSFLLANLLFPCKIFLNFATNFTTEYIKTNYLTLFISVGILAVLVALGHMIPKMLTKDAYQRKVYNYSTSISNYAYFGYVLVESVLGPAAQNNMMVFCIPFSVYCYTFGVAMLMNRDSSIKSLFNTITVAIALGIVWGLMKLPLPGVVKTVMKNASNCVGPVSMVLVGIALSTFTVRQLLPNFSVIVFCGIRLMAVPFVVYGICKGLSFVMTLPEAVYPSAVLMACMPCGLNTVVFPRMLGKDCSLGAKLILLSSLLACVTIPFWLNILI